MSLWLSLKPIIYRAIHGWEPFRGDIRRLICLGRGCLSVSGSPLLAEYALCLHPMNKIGH